MGFSAVTNTIQNSVNLTAAFVVQRPTTGVGGIAGEPAISIANILMGTILGAPFKWEWNRVSKLNAFDTVVGVSDYQVNLADFGYLEKAIVINSDADPAKGQTPNFEMEVYKILGKEAKLGRPLRIATLLDNNNGFITFRLAPTPNAVYTIGLDYQKAPVWIPQGADLTTTTWAPIPDKMSYIYQRGFMAHMQGIYNSQMFFVHMSMFFRQLVAACEGLTETEKAIFLEDQLRVLKTQQAELMGVQQGKASRAQ